MPKQDPEHNGGRNRTGVKRNLEDIETNIFLRKKYLRHTRILHRRVRRTNIQGTTQLALRRKRVWRSNDYASHTPAQTLLVEKQASEKILNV